MARFCTGSSSKFAATSYQGPITRPAPRWSIGDPGPLELAGPAGGPAGDRGIAARAREAAGGGAGAPGVQGLYDLALLQNEPSVAKCRLVCFDAGQNELSEVEVLMILAGCLLNVCEIKLVANRHKVCTFLLFYLLHPYPKNEVSGEQKKS